MLYVPLYPQCLAQYFLHIGSAQRTLFVDKDVMEMNVH